VLLGGGTFKKWGLVEGIRSLKVCFWRKYWDSSSFLILSLIPGCCEVNRFLPLCASTMRYCAQSNRPKWLWTRTCRTVSQNKPFLLVSWLSQVFCYNDGKLTNPSVLLVLFLWRTLTNTHSQAESFLPQQAIKESFPRQTLSKNKKVASQGFLSQELQLLFPWRQSWYPFRGSPHL
jgi:hypothetical protein